ncbi:hypothetical protein [Acetobacter fabarum]|uniref:hypothetical protein n=1 Tax=Acetobacter fabarum TaxID=483199 RepID=UPI000BF2291F|nr:hypothetical protein CRM93_14950 [Acetobacter fabarum]
MELQYEGFVKFADGEVISIQCFEGRCSECTDETRAGDIGSDIGQVIEGPLPGGLFCEHGCEHGPAKDREGGSRDMLVTETNVHEYVIEVACDDYR